MAVLLVDWGLPRAGHSLTASIGPFPVPGTCQGLGTQCGHDTGYLLSFAAPRLGSRVVPGSDHLPAKVAAGEADGGLMSLDWWGWGRGHVWAEPGYGGEVGKSNVAFW